MRQTDDNDESPGRDRDARMLQAGEKILANERRLAGFQAASLALAPIVGATAADEGQLIGEELHERLQALGEHLRSAESWPREGETAIRETAALADAFDRLDADLARYAALLCSALDSVPRSRLHSGAAVETAQHAGIASLVDFVLDTDPDLERYATVTDRLVTLLSTAEQGRRRCVVCDPTTLTPSLNARCERAAANAALELSAIESEFLEAARRFEEGHSEDILLAMDERKSGLGAAILAPRVLRAVVFFNAAAWTDSLDRRGWGPGEVGVDRGDEAVEGAAAPIAADGAEPRPRALDARPEAPRREEPDAGPDPGTEGTGPLPATADADVSEVRWRIDPPSAEPPPARREEATPEAQRTRLRLLVMGASLAAVLLLATRVGWLGTGGDVQTLSEADLGAISAQLDSGYRDRDGTGTLFVGTVGADWKDLSSEEREQNAREIVSRLGESGLHEVLLYDDHQRVALHAAEGLPLQIGP